MENLTIEKSTNLKEKPSNESLGFGNVFTDHMFVMDYAIDKGWYNQQIVPYQDIKISPACMAIHYGQSVFEGLKAYATTSGKTLLFRPLENLKRLNRSNERMCIPEIDIELVLNYIKELINLDKEWIPKKPGTALYIRPFVFATDPLLGVSPSATYKFMVILSPVGAYYKEGLNPVNIYVETNYVRSVRGGVGFAKTCGNYAASLKAQKESKQKGFSQVLWLDALERKYVEEVGTMNIFFKIGDKIITPPITEGSILPGVTRDSVITLLKSWDIDVVERKISIDEVLEASDNSTLKEVFGTGTAAVISPVGKLTYNEKEIEINNMQIGELSSKIYDTVTGMQYGKLEDNFEWLIEI